MVAIKKLLFPSLLILLIISSVNSRGVKQFRSGKCSLVLKKIVQKDKTGRKLECDPQLDTGCKCGLGRRQDKCWQGALRGILTSHWAAGTKLEAGAVYFWPGEGSTEKEVGGQGQVARR